MTVTRVPDGWRAVLQMASEVPAPLRDEGLESLEIFAGVGTITDAALDMGLGGYKFELQDSTVENVLTQEAHE
eukprot:6491117-Amphidinium_carterae.4